MSIKRKKILSYVVLLVSVFGLVIIDFGRTFAWIIRNGEIVTSAFNGYQVFNLDANSYYTVNGTPFSNDESDKPSLSIVSGNFTITGSNIEKSGDGTSSELDGNNAAIKVSNGSTLLLQIGQNGGSVTTNGTYSSGIYVDGAGSRVSIGYIPILTHSSYSSGIVAVNGGVVTSNYSNIETMGNNSSAISNFGGNVTVNGGTFKTNEINSSVIEALGNVSINRGATLTSNKSDGILVDGNHSVTLNNSKLSVNGENYKGVSLHQSGNKDDSSSVSFTASNNTMATNNGDMFYITNTKAVIKLVNNTISTNGGIFMRIEGYQFGTDGVNGGDVILNLSNQNVSGNIIIDDISKLQMVLSDKSVFEGAISSENSTDSVSLKLSSDSKFVLTGNTYLSSLENDDITNSNIDLNGHDLYVNGEKLVIGSGGSNSSGDGGTDSGTASDGNNNEGTSDNSSLDSNSSIASGGSNSDGKENNSGSTDTSSGENKQGQSDSNQNKDEVSVKQSEQPSVDVNHNENDVSSNNDVKKDEVKIGEKDSDDEVIKTIGSSDSQRSQSIHSIDDKTLVIVNIIGVILIITSIVSLIRIRKLKE